MIISRHELEYNVDVVLDAGQLYIGEKPMIVKTLLGSCLSVIFYHPLSKVGAVSHTLLPLKSENDRDVEPYIHSHISGLKERNCFRFVDCTIHYLVKQFELMDISRQEIVVKLFGGARTLEGNIIDVGHQNIEIAHKTLNEYGLKVDKESTGGVHGRIIYFNTCTGAVFLRLL